jgi:hypothetical protein
VSAARQAKRDYRPGETAPATGIYSITHRDHRPAHTAVLIKGEDFPHCRTCKDQVRFCMKYQAEHVRHDWDFAGPSESLSAE